MNEVTLHIDKAGHPIDCHMDGEPDRPVSAFILLANVPADPPGMVFLTYGNSSSVGNMIMSMYQRSVMEAPQTAWVLEQVARGIIGFADAERAKWPDDSMAGKA